MRKAQDIYQQLARQLQQLQLPLASCGEDTTALRRALVAGLFPNSARKQPDGTYKVAMCVLCMCVHACVCVQVYKGGYACACDCVHRCCVGLGERLGLV